MIDKKPLVLVADDDLSLGNAVACILEKIDCEVIKAYDGIEALRLYERHRPDLIILDLRMPKCDGLTVLRSIRSVDNSVPVLILSAKGDIADKRQGFQAGVDDYLVKPFSGEELQLRVLALLRRSYKSANQKEMSEIVHIGDLEINLHTGDIKKKNNRVDLAPKEARIVTLLAENLGVVFSKEEIIEAIWGNEYVGTSISISTYMRRIRKKIEDDPANPRYIQTVWGVGYQMKTT